MNAPVQHPAPSMVLRGLDELLPYARNSRTHSPSQVGEIAASITEFGMVGGIVVRDGVIAKGHGTLAAARRIYEGGGLVYPAPGKAAGAEPYPAGRVPVLDVSGWSDAQFRAYVIADNKLAENAGWDVEALGLELLDLKADGFDLSLTGFDDMAMSELMAGVTELPSAGDKDPDAVPDAPAVPHSRTGDVWVCGPHRIACGDCSDMTLIDELMQGEVADICVTDPPYNVAYESKLAGSIKNDDMSDAEFRRMLRSWYDTMFAVMKPGAPIYVAHADIEGLNFRHEFRAAGFKLSGCLIWRKNSMVLGRSDYQWQHEPILYGWKPGAAHRWYGGRKRTTVVEYGESGPVRRLEDGRWAITVGDTVLVVDGEAHIEESPSSVIYHDKPSRSELHPTTKPTGLWERLMKPSSRAGDIVIDWFSGSGTTMIAADRMGLIARVCEIDPKFVDVGVRRWQQLTGRRAVHAVTGEPFPDEGEVRGEAPVVAAAEKPSGDMF